MSVNNACDKQYIVLKVRSYRVAALLIRKGITYIHILTFRWGRVIRKQKEEVRAGEGDNNCTFNGLLYLEVFLGGGGGLLGS